MSSYSQRSSSWKKIIATPLAVSFLVTAGGAAVPQLLTAAAAQPSSSVPGGLQAIDTTQPVSLTLHKLVNPANLGQPATGLPQDVAAQAPVYLNGITFNATLLDTSNMTNAVNGMTFSQLTPEEVAALTADQYMAYGAKRTTTVVSGTTADGGPLTLPGMQQGVYLVEEVIPSNTVLTASNGQSYNSSSVKAAAPFIVSLPMLTPTKDAWNYNVNVYPKNSAFKSTKSVVDAGANAGGTITYTLDTEIPKETSSPTDTYNLFRVEDVLDSSFIDPNSVVVTSVELVTNAGDSYLTLPTADYTSSMSSNKLQVELTSSGLANLHAQNVGAQVRVIFSAKLVDGAVFTKQLNNTFVSNVGFASGASTTATSNTVESKYANLTVQKFVSGTTNPLQGATFELWQCTADTVPQPIGSAIPVNGATSWTTSAEGTVNINGIQVEDFVNNAPRAGFHYCLKETAAPTGFVQLTNLVPISVKSTDADTNTNTAALDLVAKVDNSPKSTPNLPLTGGQGIALLVAIGAGLVGLAAWVARRNSKKTSH